ncbi:MAG: hypothetical protein KIT11_05530 [Fimbriimonadaceae bacterium]|nr:hypothetical protein [Fimbriimonadaceae bacterium]QYK56646.1 MAG: hypothetical protein KF733_03990 [Fimbriimonadaceae bacterium]
MITAKDVLEQLTRLRLAGLSDYGRWPKEPRELAAMASVYAEALADLGVEDQSHLVAAVRKLCATGGDFPSAAELGRACLRAEEDSTVLVWREVEPGTLAFKRVAKDGAVALPAVVA